MKSETVTKNLAGVGHTAVTGSAASTGDGEDVFLSRPTSASRAPAGNSRAMRLRPGPRYRARLAHYMYVYEGKSMTEIGRELGVTRQRVQQYVSAVESTLDGREIERQRNHDRRNSQLEIWHEPVRERVRLGMTVKAIQEDLEDAPRWVVETIIRALPPEDRVLGRNRRVYHAPTERIDDEELLEWVRTAARNQETPLSGGDYAFFHIQHPESPCLSTITNRFEHFREAARLAGIDFIDRPGSGMKMRFTREYCIESARQIIKTYGYVPGVSGWSELATDNPDIPSRSTVVIRFGSWSNFILELEKEGIL